MKPIPPYTQMGIEFRKARLNTPDNSGAPLTQATLVELAGISKEGTVSRLENGHRPSRTTFLRLLGAINDRRKAAGLPPVAIAYTSDQERSGSGSLSAPRIQEGYWVEKIECLSTRQTHFSLVYLYQLNGRWILTGWSSMGSHEEWYSNGYHFDDAWRNLYYTYSRGRGLSQSRLIGGFGGILLSPAKDGSPVVPVSGWFVNMERNTATAFQCVYLTLQQAVSLCGRRCQVPDSNDLGNPTIRERFLGQLVSKAA